MWRAYKHILGFLAFFVLVVFWIFRPHYTNKIIDIYGLSTDQAINKLSNKGIVNKYAIKFLMYIDNQPIKFGEYSFKGFVSPFGVYEKLIRGDFLKYKITIPEGFDMYEIASRLQKYGICSKDTFLTYAQDKYFIHSLGLNTSSFEGYLFPDTYFFYKHENPKIIISTMYSAFKNTMKENNLNPTYKQIIIASIVEKEAKFKKDKSLVASVIYNRLRKNMPLQMDSTIIYALKYSGLWSGALYRKDFSIKSPYNTYIVKGLPPSPICNPGIRSIKAAIDPAHSDYLYFVDDKSGDLIFNKSFKSHVKSVEKSRS